MRKFLERVSMFLLIAALILGLESWSTTGVHSLVLAIACGHALIFATMAALWSVWLYLGEENTDE